MSCRFQELLERVYAPPVAAETAGRIARRVEEFHRTAAGQRPRVPEPGAGGASAGARTAAPTAGDALLITYADQVRAPGEAPLVTLARLAETRLRGAVSGLHLLPFYPWTSDDGFAVQDFHAVAPEYGSWVDIARLGRNFDLMFDGVFNHLSAGSEWFRRFLADDPAYRDFFVTMDGDPDLSAVIRPRALPLLTEFASARGPLRVWTTFSADQVDLNFGHPRVLEAVVDVMLFYLRHGARYLRLDAIAFLWKEVGTTCLHRPQTHAIVQFLRAVVDAAAPGVRLITETNVPHADNVSYFGDGTNEAHLVYNFALPPLVLHALQTGDARALTGWAQGLTLPSREVTFFNFLASHDGIGLNPARGILRDDEIDALVARTLARGGYVGLKHLPDGSTAPYEMNINYLDALTDPAAGEPVAIVARRFLCAQAIMLCLQGVPGIYFHSLFGSRGDRAGAEASGIKRRINRQKLELAALEAELADPASLRAQVFSGYAELLRVRRANPALAPAAAQRVPDLDPRVFAVERTAAANGGRLLCLHNVSGEAVVVPLPAALGGGRVDLPPWGWRWRPLSGAGSSGAGFRGTPGGPSAASVRRAG